MKDSQKMDVNTDGGQRTKNPDVVAFCNSNQYSLGQGFSTSKLGIGITCLRNVEKKGEETSNKTASELQLI